tara:strand:+ start:166 stop:306 length:141 start_codon:yes stop_codon:yes gene_type:complete
MSSSFFNFLFRSEVPNETKAMIEQKQTRSKPLPDLAAEPLKSGCAF